MRQQVIKHKNIKKEMSLSLYIKNMAHGLSLIHILLPPAHGQWLLAAVDRLRADWAAHPDDHPAQVSVQSAVRNPY